MRWASTVSLESTLAGAVEEATEGIRAQLGTRAPDLLIVFASAHFRGAYHRVPELIERGLAPGVLMGCSAGGVIGGGREVERSPALSLTGALLPGVDVTPVLLDATLLPDATAPPSAWEERIHVPASRNPHFLLLPDPYTFDAEALLKGLDTAYPYGTKIGGLASGGSQPGANALYLGHKVHRGGVVGVALSGDIEVDAIVAQGCRPIGEPMFVTAADRNVICELDGRRPVDVLRELYQRSDPRDRKLFRNGLFLGTVMRDSQQEYRRGDFLVRNILGIEEETGRLAVGTIVREGMVVQCHLQDARTSADDLRDMLLRYAERSREMPPQGCLLFSCLGRGAALYGQPNYDSAEFRRRIGNVPLGGFFCNGEIGPVHGTAFLHGYTSSFGMFRSRIDDDGRRPTQA